MYFRLVRHISVLIMHETIDVGSRAHDVIGSANDIERNFSFVGIKEHTVDEREARLCSAPAHDARLARRRNPDHLRRKEHLLHKLPCCGDLLP